MKKLFFWFLFSKTERRLIMEGLHYGEEIWYNSFRQTFFDKEWMNKKRNEFLELKTKLT